MANVSKYVLGLLFFGILACLLIPASSALDIYSKYTISNQNIEYFEDIVIHPGGHLIIDNSIITFKCGYDGQYGIVAFEGTNSLNDGGDISIINNSYIKGYPKSTYIYIQQGFGKDEPNYIFTDSTFENFGYYGSEYGKGGIEIRAQTYQPENQIDNITVLNGARGIYSFSYYLADVTNSKFINISQPAIYVRDLAGDRKTIISNNVFDTVRMSIYTDGVNNVIIENNTHDNVWHYTIDLWGSIDQHVIIQNEIINNSYKPIVINSNSHDILISNVTAMNRPVYGGACGVAINYNVQNVTIEESTFEKLDAILITRENVDNLVSKKNLGINNDYGFKLVNQLRFVSINDLIVNSRFEDVVASNSDLYFYDTKYNISKVKLTNSTIYNYKVINTNNLVKIKNTKTDEITYPTGSSLTLLNSIQSDNSYIKIEYEFEYKISDSKQNYIFRINKSMDISKSEGNKFNVAWDGIANLIIDMPRVQKNKIFYPKRLYNFYHNGEKFNTIKTNNEHVNYQFVGLNGTIELNGSNSWADTSGTMLEHGDGNLRSPPNVTINLSNYWSYKEGAGTILTDVWSENDGTIPSDTWWDGERLHFPSGAHISLDSYIQYSTTNEWTICIWAEQDAGETVEGMLFGDDTSQQLDYIWFNNETYLRFINSTGGYAEFNNINDFTGYHHYFFESNGTHISIYIDNVFNQTIAVGTSFNFNTIGGGWTTTVFDFDGYMGVSYIYNKTLSILEKTDIYNNNYNISAYIQNDNILDAGSNQVHKYVEVLGTDPSTNTSLSLWVNGSDDNIFFGGWEVVNSSFNADDNVTIGIAYEYRYAIFKVYSNTTYQPETSIVSNITITSDTPTITAPVVTLLSMTPSEICQNCTGNLSILYGISHSSAGLNNTSVSFIYRNYDYDCACSNHSIRPPNNNLATLWDLDGRILRAANRNESLNFENNVTITGGDDYTWSGLDENNTGLIIVPVNSTYTKVYINKTIHCVMPQMWYLDRTDIQEAPKTQLGIYKTQNVLIKFWNLEIFKGNTDFLGVGYTDTALESNPALHPLDANLVNFYYVSDGYDPAIGGDPLTSGYAVYMGSLNASRWVDHVHSPHANSSYVRGFIDNTLLETYVNTTNISYLYFTSNTPSSKPYYINVTNVASSTNVSFANTNVLWAGDTPPYTAQAYTPNIWFAFMKLNQSLDYKLYVADNNNKWGNSTMNRMNITSGLFPPTKPSFYSFHNGFTDYDMNKTYHDTIQIQVGASSDPDGGIVTHNITLHYGNGTYIATINGSAVAEDGVYTNITFNTTLYYSQTENYTLRVVATDDESETATTWLGVNFSLDGSPRIISYSPGTPVYSREGENQTFSITTNILGNVTWYIDSVEVFNETLVTYSSYSNSTASLGYHNVTVITTNINGTNSMTWDWTVRTRLWSLVVDSIAWSISVAQYLVSNIGIVITTAFSLICILILMMLIGAALSVTNIIFR